MKTLACLMIVGACTLGMQHAATQPGMPGDPTVSAYENLATAIIAIRATEENLVHGLLAHHYLAAVEHLGMAGKATGRDRARHLEMAGTEIANLASEGSKPVQAVRQRLLQAGHHHHTDAETADDYIFIDGREKEAFIALATRVARMPESASARDLDAAKAELEKLFEKAVAPE